MEGIRLTTHADLIGRIREDIATLSDIEQVRIVHEIVDDTPYKTESYMKYLHDEYYIQHSKPELIESALKTYALRVSERDVATELIPTIRNRNSLRDYENAPVDFDAFSEVLHYGFGVKYVGRGAYGRREFPFKFSNSQGGLNYLDLYVIVNNVAEVEQGLYYYDFIGDRICMLDRGNMRGLLGEINFQNEFTVYSNFVCFLVADLARVVPKYFKRAYRFAHVDAGILVAYLQLLAEENGLGSCAVAGFLEHKLEVLLSLSADEYPIVSLSVGCKPEMAAV